MTTNSIKRKNWNDTTFKNLTSSFLQYLNKLKVFSLLKIVRFEQHNLKK